MTKHQSQLETIMHSVLTGSQADVRSQAHDWVHTLCEHTVSQMLTEIQWHSSAVVNSALDAEIYCGFEAETVWGDDANAELWADILTADYVDQMSFDDVEVQDFIREQSGSSVIEEIYNDYIDALTDSAAYNDAYSQTFDGMRSSIIDDDDRLEEFLSDTDAAETYAEDIGEYRQKQIEYLQHQRRRREEQRDIEAELLQDPDQRSDAGYVTRQTARVEHITQVIAALDRELARYQSGDIDQQTLLAEYFRDEHTDGAPEFFDWANEVVEREHEDDIREQAWQDAQEEYPIDAWIEDQDLTLSRFLRTYDIYVADSDGYIDQIGEYVYQGWITNQSAFDDYVSGEYNTTGDDPTIWHIETDGSIKGGLGAEIVSPVYDSPREMLDEMFDLFDWLVRQGVFTNSSTGLHVTMSMPGSPGQINPVKMAVMLDDLYLLRQFDRLDSIFTRSQLQRLIDRASAAAKSSGDLSDVERALAPAISERKMRSINFKDAANNEGNQLIEFRIAGGANYIKQVDKVRDAVVRYATIMQLGYDADAYRREYATKLARLLNRATEVDASTDSVTVTVDPVTDLLLQAVKELGITDKDTLSEIRSLLAGSVTSDDDDDDDEQRKLQDAQRKLHGVLKSLTKALVKGYTSKQPTVRVSRLLRSAIQKTGGSVEEAAKQVVYELEWLDRNRVAQALSKLLAAPKLLDVLGASPVQRVIRFDPYDNTLLIRGSVLNHLKNGTLEHIDPHQDIKRIDSSISRELAQLGVNPTSSEPDDPESAQEYRETVLPEIKQRVQTYLDLVQRSLGGPLFHHQEPPDNSGNIRTNLHNWGTDQVTIQDNVWYVAGGSPASQSAAQILKELVTGLKQIGVYIEPA